MMALLLGLIRQQDALAHPALGALERQGRSRKLAVRHRRVAGLVRGLLGCCSLGRGVRDIFVQDPCRQLPRHRHREIPETAQGPQVIIGRIGLASPAAAGAAFRPSRSGLVSGRIGRGRMLFVHGFMITNMEISPVNGLVRRAVSKRATGTSVRIGRHRSRPFAGTGAVHALGLTELRRPPTRSPDGPDLSRGHLLTAMRSST